MEGRSLTFECKYCKQQKKYDHCKLRIQVSYPVDAKLWDITKILEVQNRDTCERLKAAINSFRYANKEPISSLGVWKLTNHFGMFFY